MARGGGRPERPASEYERVEGGPMTPEELARIWRGLPEERRLPFVLSLEETLAGQVMELTWRTQKEQR